ncbi:unnamed protein product [Agarophyton chilense]|eukprot:gb/GEZJ01002951.1/.p1 GENE.gb/GEZJ01002951.1/~~gb/GEZJ01002951.1/.p1  ORF type:complete len:410 (-),score=53.59 gb/GEZJ01002951.1/:2992-4221(-)
MQRHPAANAHLPYSKWSQHRAENGLIYLSHPVTSEVKWLWSRHTDPKTSNDYLVNTISGERQWVTENNQHLCPVSSDKSTNQEHTKNAAAANGSTNPFAAEKRAQPKKPANPGKPQHFGESAKYREIAAPKSLGLTADEVLMLVPETGRRYIFNKKTNSSRWLPDRPPDTIPSALAQRTFLGRAKSKSSASIDNDIHPDLREMTKAPFFDPEAPPIHDHNASPASTAHRIPVPRAVDNNSTNIPTNQQSTKASPTPQHFRTANTPSTASSSPNPDKKFASQSNLPTSSGKPGARRGVSPHLEKNENPATEKLSALGSIIDNVNKITASGRYDINQLRCLATMRGKEDEVQDGSRRLLELEEYLTQQMLKVDAVESEGNQLVRVKRKETVNTILGLTDEIEQLRTKLKNL